MFGKAPRADRRIAEARPLSSCRRTFSLSFQLISKAFRRHFEGISNLQKQQHLPSLDHSSSLLKRPYRYNMAQPNIPNFNAAIAGISQAANDITLKVQDFNTHQQALGNELLLFANAPVAQIQQQLTDILAAINQSNLLNSARYTSRPIYPIL